MVLLEDIELKEVSKLIIEKIVGNVFDLNDENLDIHWLDMPFDHAHKKIHRFYVQGKEFGLKLSEEDRKRGLKHGDIVYREGNLVYAINIAEEECLKILMPKLESMVEVAYTIGNRHAKLYWGEGKKFLLTPYEETLEAMLAGVEGIKLEKTLAKLLAKNNLMAILPQGGVVGHGHDHDHSHIHDHNHDHGHSHKHHHE